MQSTSHNEGAYGEITVQKHTSALWGNLQAKPAEYSTTINSHLFAKWSFTQLWQGQCGKRDNCSFLFFVPSIFQVFFFCLVLYFSLLVSSAFSSLVTGMTAVLLSWTSSETGGVHIHMYKIVLEPRRNEQDIAKYSKLCMQELISCCRILWCHLQLTRPEMWDL